MIKRKLLAVAALAALVGAVPRTAQSQMWIPFVGGGAAFATGDIKDAGSKTGWMGFAGLDYTLAAFPGAAVGVTLSYAHIPYEGGGGDATNIPAGTVDVAYAFGATTGAMIQPYIRAGVGVLQHRYDHGNTSNSNTSETKFGGSAGAGINFNLGTVNPFVGVHFITAGSSTEYYTVYGGLAFPLSGAAPAKSISRLIRR